MSKHKYNSKLDMGLHEYLYKGSYLVGDEGMPLLLDNAYIDLPKDFISIKDVLKGKFDLEDRKKYIHFFEYDKEFNDFLYDIEENISIIQQFAGIVGPDCTMLSGAAPLCNKVQVFYSRAVTYYLQTKGINVILLARWCDEKSLDYALDGIPNNAIICVSPYGCTKTREQRIIFKQGLQKLIQTKNPKHIYVYGQINKKIFCGIPSEKLTLIYSKLDKVHGRGC